jgi:hypothetical protein
MIGVVELKAGLGMVNSSWLGKSQSDYAQGHDFRNSFIL